MDETVTDETRDLARMMRAARAWALAFPVQQVLTTFAEVGPVHVAVPLDGVPVACADLKSLGVRTRDEGGFLLVDATLTGVRACEALRLGAHAYVCGLSETLCVLGVSRDAERALPGVGERLDALAAEAPASVPDALELIERADERWHHTSDAAQVVASYLRCHPRIGQLAYPGLKSDPSFSVAARTLQGGFGPLVDVRLVGDEGWRRVTCDGRDAKLQVLALEEELATGAACGVPLA